MANELYTTPILEKYQESFRSNPKSRVFAPLAEGYRRLGLTDKAYSVLKTGLHYHPHYVPALMIWAQCQVDEQDFRQAYDILQPYIESHRDNLKLQRLYAKICEKLDRNSEALETYKYLLFLNPGDAETAQAVDRLENQNIATETSRNLPLNEQQLEDFSEVDDQWTEKSLFEMPKNYNEEHSEKLSSKPSNENTTEYSFNEDIVEFEVLELPAEELPDSDEKLFSFTLVDLYCQQGSIDKAQNLVEDYLSANPGDQRAIDKLKELKEIDISEKTEDLDDKDSVMNKFDSLVCDGPDIDLVQQKNENRQKYLNWLQAFLGQVKDKSMVSLRK